LVSSTKNIEDENCTSDSTGIQTPVSSMRGGCADHWTSESHAVPEVKIAVFDTLYIHPPTPQTWAADVKPPLFVDSLNYYDFSLVNRRMAGVLVSALTSHAGEQGSSPSGFCKRLRNEVEASAYFELLKRLLLQR